MNRRINAVFIAGVLGLHFATVSFAQDRLPVPPAPEHTILAPPVAVGPYNVYDEPVYVASEQVTPVLVVPVYVQPVEMVPVFVASGWYAPTFVEVCSSPWSRRAEYEYATPYGAGEIEYRVNRHGGVRIEYDD